MLLNKIVFIASLTSIAIASPLATTKSEASPEHANSEYFTPRSESYRDIALPKVNHSHDDKEKETHRFFMILCEQSGNSKDDCRKTWALAAPELCKLRPEKCNRYAPAHVSRTETYEETARLANGEQVHKALMTLFVMLSESKDRSDGATMINAMHEVFTDSGDQPPKITVLSTTLKSGAPPLTRKSTTSTTTESLSLLLSKPHESSMALSRVLISTQPARLDKHASSTQT